MWKYERAAPRTFIGFFCLGLSLGSVGCKPQEQVDRERAERAAAEQAAQVKPAMEAQKAAVGVGIKGDSLEADVAGQGPGRLIAAPVHAYFKVKERAVFDIQIPHMLNLYNALHGRAPQNHDEFMREIEANRIQLPKLPEGMRYAYRADVGELWVEPIGD